MKEEIRRLLLLFVSLIFIALGVICFIGFNNEFNNECSGSLNEEDLMCGDFGLMYFKLMFSVVLLSIGLAFLFLTFAPEKPYITKMKSEVHA